MKNKLDKATTKRFNDWKKLCFDKPTDNETKAFIATEKQKSFDEALEQVLRLIGEDENTFVISAPNVKPVVRVNVENEVYVDRNKLRQELRASINKLKESK